MTIFALDMTLYKFTSVLDRLGMTASTLCALHCLVMPLLLMVMPFAGLAFLMQTWFDLLMIVGGLAIGLVSLGISYVRHHRCLLPILLFLTGFAVIAAAHLHHAHATFSVHNHIHKWDALESAHVVHSLKEMIFLFAGGICVAVSHLINWRYNRRHCAYNET